MIKYYCTGVLPEGDFPQFLNFTFANEQSGVRRFPLLGFPCNNGTTRRLNQCYHLLSGASFFRFIAYVGSYQKNAFKLSRFSGGIHLAGASLTGHYFFTLDFLRDFAAPEPFPGLDASFALSVLSGSPVTPLLS